jgi:hypothetical protein
MIRRVVTRRRLGERDPDVTYWRTHPVAERIAHIEACAPSTTVGPMDLDRDFSEFIACCVGHDVRLLIVNGRRRGRRLAL